MKLNSTDLPGAHIVSTSPSLKMAEHSYDYSDQTDYTVLGSGPTKLAVAGTCKTEASRLDVEYICRQPVEKKLYFPSQVGGSDDRYYRVYTTAAHGQPETARLWRYSFEAMTVVPWVYDAATNQPVAGQGAS